VAEAASLPSAMDELAIVQAGGGEFAAACNDSIAEHNFNRKKMLQLEQGIGSLEKAARQHNQVVTQLESGLKAMISETDLRRAIGLAFQEFEHRLEDAFQDSNRKCLAMFSRRDDVSELQGQINKRVSWAEFNSVMKKMADLRQYIDTMADSVFIGHREALNGEFAKKADKQTVEEALKMKADTDDVNEVRARLERLEVMVSHTDARQTSALEALRDEMDQKRSETAERQQAAINQNAATMTDLKAAHDAILQRLSGAEAEITSLGTASNKLREVQQLLKSRQDEVILPKMSEMQEQLQRVEAAAGQMQQDLQTMERDAADFREGSQRTVEFLSSQVKSSKENVEFLLQETEMIKRRAVQLTKKHTASCEKHTDEQERLSQQLQALERDLKRQGRDVRAAAAGRSQSLDDHSAVAGLRALTGGAPGGALAALPAPPDATAAADAGDRLRSMMEQIERIAFSGPAHEQLGVPYNPERPPLPISSKAGGCPSLVDSERLPRFSAAMADPAPIDSARGGFASSNTARGMYGLSPRVSPGRAGKKKR